MSKDQAKLDRTELDDPKQVDALQHPREPAKDTTVALLTDTKHAEISEAAVLVQLIRG